MPLNVLITGANSGFGLLTTRTFAEAGHLVHAGYRNPAKLAGLQALVDEGLAVHTVEIDAEAASAAFGAAMQAYQTPLAQPGEPAPPGTKTYPSAAERAKAANALFASVADKYGMTPSGQNARYFAGLTAMEAGQNQQAEDTLKKVASGWDSSLSGLAKMALAGLYRDTGRDAQAIDLYNQLSAKPTVTVPYGLARLQLADLYTAEGKAGEAKKIYADLEDKDKKGPAGAIAKEKLNPAPASGPMGLPQ